MEIDMTADTEKLQNRIDLLEDALRQAYEYIEREADTVGGPDGDEPNEALSLASYIINILEG